MKSALLKKYPPYEGAEPYIFLCFASEDAKAAEPLLARLWRRGCRVWYTVGESLSVAQEKADQERMKNASLAVAFCSESFLRSSAKSRLMYLQSRNMPVISVDSAPVDNLSAGFREDTPHIAAYGGITDGTEAGLISTEGFSADFIGERPHRKISGAMKALLILLLGLIAAALIFLILTASGILRPEPEIPPEEITVLRLDALPRDIGELESYPKLEKIILPQSEAEKAVELTDRYIIVLTGEGS